QAHLAAPCAGLGYCAAFGFDGIEHVRQQVRHDFHIGWLVGEQTHNFRVRIACPVFHAHVNVPLCRRLWFNSVPGSSEIAASNSLSLGFASYFARLEIFLLMPREVRVGSAAFAGCSAMVTSEKSSLQAERIRRASFG